MPLKTPDPASLATLATPPLAAFHRASRRLCRHHAGSFTPQSTLSQPKTASNSSEMQPSRFTAFSVY